jgi:predicted RND superfamily exporter protein
MQPPVTFLIDRRGALLAFSLVLTVLLGLGIPRTGFDTSLGVLLTKSDPYLQQRNHMEESFPARVEISFALLPDSKNVFERETLLALADLNREFRSIPLALSMNSILNWQSPFGDQSLFPSVVTAQTRFAEQDLLDAKQRVLNDPFLSAGYIAPAFDLALASVRLRVTSINSQQSREIVQASNVLIQSLQERHPSVQFYVSSEAHYEQSNRDAMISDLSFLLPLVLLLCTAIICLSFRSVALGCCILGVALLTVLMTIGALTWAGQDFNTISVMAPLVVVTIAVADSVHVISIFRQSLQQGLSPTAAMSQSLRLNLRPISLATITTLIGFASLNLASSPAISSFGTVVAIGVAIAYFLTLCVLPALVLLLPATLLGKIGPNGGMAIINGSIRIAQSLVAKHGSALMLVFGTLGVVSVGLSFLNNTDFDRASFISKDSPLHDYYAAVSERMDRGTPLSYGIELATPYGSVEPDFLQRLDGFAQWLREQEQVLGVTSLVEVVKTVNQVMNDDDVAFYRIPDTLAEVEDALFNYSVAQVRDFKLDTLVNEDFSLVRVFVSTNTQSNEAIVELSERIDQEFARQMPEARLLHGSSTLLFARMDKAVTVELLQGYAFSLLMITLTLIIGMRSVYYGLLSVLPNLLPAVLVFGAWGLLVGSIDPFVMMLFSISIGLVVDDTVHVLSTYQTSRTAGLVPAAAIDRALEKAGPALIITTAVMALGTCVLIGASTLYFQQAATLLVPIVVLALLLDLTFFPALLVRFDLKSRGQKSRGQVR